MSNLITSFFKSPPSTVTNGAPVSMAISRTEDGEPLSLPSSQCSSNNSSDGKSRGDHQVPPVVVDLIGLIGSGNTRLLEEGGKKEKTRTISRKNGAVFSLAEHLCSTVTDDGSIVKEEVEERETGVALPGVGGTLMDVPSTKGVGKKKKKKRRKMNGHPTLSELDDADSTVSLTEGEGEVASVDVTRRGSGYVVEDCMVTRRGSGYVVEESTVTRRGSGYVVEESMVTRRGSGYVVEESMVTRRGSGYLVEESMVIESDKDVEWLSPLKCSPQKPAGTLCNAWTKLFNKAPRPGPSETTPPSSPKRSPSRRKRNGSPLRPPRQPAARPSSLVASPLKKSQTCRQLPFTRPCSQTTPPITMLPLDAAPFDGLVHVQQKREPGTAEYWCLAQADVPRPSPSEERGLATPCGLANSSLLGLMSSGADATSQPSWKLPQQIKAVSAGERESALADLASSHPGRNVAELCSRYTSTHHSSHPHHPHTLTCSIKIRPKQSRGKIKVDTSAYAKPRNTRRTVKRRVKSKPATEAETKTTPPPHNPLHNELWTEVYRPKTASEVLGNRQQVEQLRAWLSKWGNSSSSSSSSNSQTTSSEKSSVGDRTVKSKSLVAPKVEARDASFLDTSSDSDFISLRHLRRKRRLRVKKCFHGNRSSESDPSGGSEDEEEGVPPRVVLLCGPHGSGKTAAVYACATELGFKVLEVNPGVVRSRTLLLSTLREATLSHQVAISNGKVAASNGERCNGRPRVKSPSDLRSFFKSKPVVVVTSSDSSRASVTLATKTVILLEEVDVVFEEDKGFWLAVSEIAMATRRPIVLTCSDPRVCPEFHHMRIQLARPDKVDLSLQIRLLGLANSVLIGQETSNQIAEHANCDIRKAINHLQMWTSWLPTNCCQDDQKSCDTTRSLLQPPFFQAPWKDHFSSRLRTSSTYSNLDTVAHSLDSLSELDHMSRGDCHVTDVPWWCSEVQCGLSDTLPLTSHDVAARGLTSDITMATESLLNSAHHHLPDWRRIADIRAAHATCLEVFSPTLSSSHVATVTECLPVLRLICQRENERETANHKRRFQHYLSACSSVDQHSLRRYGQPNLCFPLKLNQCT